ncbi:hypothetical protein [Brevibacillus brevis]|uniref:VCBS repeat-containing protein n=1 Tax=Brevibacillus brevis TaxID=1393 RepID=A0ABY9T1Y5_BREBE|nr:hypothetical protein [Brevibacillus brevis]WNC13953.1 hypothetical protein RGB73_25245 [Brevibacillus brevis]
MNKNWMKPVTFMLLAGVIGGAGLAASHMKVAHAESEIGKPFAAASELKLDKNYTVIDQKSADVTGDNVADMVYLVGSKEKPDDIYAFGMKLVVQDGKTKAYAKTDLGDLGGYEGELTLADFTGDHVADAFVKTATGGSGGIYSHVIATFADKQGQVIFGEKENEGIKYEGAFVNGFKVEGKGTHLDKPLTVDVSGNKDLYVAAKVYDQGGKLVASPEDLSVYSYPFGSLTPIDMDGNGTFELVGEQRIVGINNTDTVSNIRSVWGFGADGKWNPWEVEYSTFLIKHPGEAVQTQMGK